MFCTGPSVAENSRHFLLKLVQQLRRFFPPGSEHEIWAEFHKDLTFIHETCSNKV
jgi:hypothetical protein